jgi:tetrahydromethanopterin S-methyltransferase subunit F
MKNVKQATRTRYPVETKETGKKGSEPTASTDSIKAYFNNIKKHSLLTPEDERVLAGRIVTSTGGYPYRTS